MSMDGAQAHNNTDHTPHEIVDFLKQGIHNDQLSEHTTHVDDALAGSQMSHSNKVDLSKAVGELLSQEGLLPRATSEFSQDNFESLSNGDKNITALDLDNVINAGLEPSFAPADAPWGERYFHIKDPDGHELSFAKPIDHRAA